MKRVRTYSPPRETTSMEGWNQVGEHHKISNFRRDSYRSQANQILGSQILIVKRPFLCYAF